MIARSGICDALSVLRCHVPLESPSRPKRDALDVAEEQIAEVRTIKQGHPLRVDDQPTILSCPFAGSVPG
jgi:hypothetical protein